jgi:dTDP-glucose 4,6-dehydratase
MIRIILGIEWQNIDLVKLFCKIMDEKLGRKLELRTIDFLCKDRPGHDLRYAIDANKINKELDGNSVTLSKDWKEQ